MTDETSQTLLLEVSINGIPTKMVGQFTSAPAGLFATAAELRSLGIHANGKDDDLLPLSAICTHTELDLKALKIDMQIPINSLNATDIKGVARRNDKVPLSDSSQGALLNYDLLLSNSQTSYSLGGSYEARYFLGNSVFSSTGLKYVAGASSVRLDTTYTYSNPGDLTRYRMGDFISSGLSWTRPVRLAGFQFGTDFTLRPDLVTYPTPSLGGAAVVPSTVDLFFNGVRQLSQPVPPGPFDIRQAPIVSGSGQFTVAVTDALGRQTLSTMSFYASDKLLEEKLASYTLEGGFVRLNYGLTSNDYDQFAMAGTARYGLSKVLTLETHAEAMRGLTTAGGGLAYNIDNLAVATASVSASSTYAAADQQYAVGLERTSRLFSVSLTRTQAGPNYRDIGAVEGTPMPRAATIGTVGINLGSYGSASLAYASSKDSTIITSQGTTGVGNSESLTLSYFKPVALGANMYVTSFRDFRNGGYGVSVGLIMPLGNNRSAGVSVNNNNGVRTTSLQASNPALAQGDIGWQLQSTSGGYQQRYGELDLKSSKTFVSLAAAQSNGATSERAGLRGAVTWMDNSVFLSNWINDSFAVVNTNGVSDVGIFNENRYAGKTDGDGKLLLTDLRAYDINKVSVDVLDLPLTQQMDKDEQYIKPRDRSGTTVTFKTRQTANISLVLKLANGDVVPMGSLARIRENGQQAPVGYDGATYFPEYGPVNTLDVTMPSGATCQSVFVPHNKPDNSMSSFTLECQ